MTWVETLVWLIHAFNRFVLGYFLVLNTTYLLLFLLSLVAVFKFVRRTFFSDYRQIMQSEMTWPISIVVAAHDEEKTIVETVRSLMMVNYGEFEIVVVNDGSNDRTLQRLIRAFDLTRTDRIYQRAIPTSEAICLRPSVPSSGRSTISARAMPGPMHGTASSRSRFSARMTSAAMALSMTTSSFETRRSRTWTSARMSRRTTERACSRRLFSATIIAMS